MGYSGLESVYASDSAADFVGGIIVPSLIENLKKEIETNKGNKYNTDGVVNVSLFLVEFILPGQWRDSDLINFVRNKVLPKLEEKIKRTEEAKWESAENQAYHLSHFVTWRCKLEEFVK